MQNKFCTPFIFQFLKIELYFVVLIPHAVLLNYDLHMSHSTITLAITGASGAVYGLRLLECLLKAKKTVYLVISEAGKLVINLETNLTLLDQTPAIQQQLHTHYQVTASQLQVFDLTQWTAPIASGSAVSNAMVICPCTSGTLSAVAHGHSCSLIERAADVTLKEQKKLILVHRETPLSVIHLENMLYLAKLGVLILPANPGFYHQPEQVSQLVDFIVARILDHLEIPHQLLPRWGEST